MCFAVLPATYPAGQKVCGFLSHNAHFACSRCFKRFPGTFGSIDLSGFDRENWPERDGKLHRHVAVGLHSFTTPAEQERKESQAGLCYSSLLQLPYFDAPRMLNVDPMHNLFLGSAKRIMQSIWIERKILTDWQFKIIQHELIAFQSPQELDEYLQKFSRDSQHFLLTSGRIGHCITRPWFYSIY